MDYNESTIAIDGPSGSGKSTLSYALGNYLDLAVLESGTLYRCVTLKCIELNVDVHDETEVAEIAENLNYEFNNRMTILDGRDVSQRIREHDVVLLVSHVSVHEKVRSALTYKMQNWILDHKGGVIEGRDITTVVAPNAKVRIFLDAPEDIRIKRRSQDVNDSASSKSEEEVAESILIRDKIDSNRKVNPLRKIEGVIELNSHDYSVEALAELIVKEYNK